MKLNAPLDHAPEAEGTWKVEENYRVAGGQTPFHGAAIVAIHDPLLARRELFHLPRPLLFRGLYPAELPVKRVQMDRRQAGTLRKASREGGLACASGSDHENSAHATNGGEPNR